MRRSERIIDDVRPQAPPPTIRTSVSTLFMHSSSNTPPAWAAAANRIGTIARTIINVNTDVYITQVRRRHLTFSRIAASLTHRHSPSERQGVITYDGLRIAGCAGV